MAYRHLTASDRQIIGKLKKAGRTQRFIANILDVSPSTICREIRRNHCGIGYCCNIAHTSAQNRRRSANRKRAKLTHQQTNFIRRQLNLTLSPEQIASLFPETFGFSINTKTIYRYIYSYKWHWRKNKELIAKLRRKAKLKRKNWHRRKKAATPRPNISQRPAEANSKTDYGHWEMDLFLGPKGSKTAALILVERKSLFSVVKRLKNKTARVVHEAIEEVLKPFIVKSVTTDNGSEFLDHASISKRINAPLFFCNPYHAWEKGLVENTIGLYREFIPKKEVLPSRQKPFSRAQFLINSRPRKTINFTRPISLLDKISKSILD